MHCFLCQQCEEPLHKQSAASGGAVVCAAGGAVVPAAKDSCVFDAEAAIVKVVGSTALVLDAGAALALAISTSLSESYTANNLQCAVAAGSSNVAWLLAATDTDGSVKRSLGISLSSLLGSATTSAESTCSMDRVGCFRLFGCRLTVAGAATRLAENPLAGAAARDAARLLRGVGVRELVPG